MFDNESIRRPPLEHAPPVGAEEALRERYRNAVADFPATGVPPVQTAHWLMKPASMVRGTWEEPKEAGEWLGLQLAEFAPRFAGGGGQGGDSAGASGEGRGGTAGLGRGRVPGALPEGNRLPFGRPRHLFPEPLRSGPGLSRGGGSVRASPVTEAARRDRRRITAGRSVRAADLGRLRYGRLRAMTIRWTWLVPS